MIEDLATHITRSLLTGYLAPFFCFMEEQESTFDSIAHLIDRFQV